MTIPPTKIHVPEADRADILCAIDACLQSGRLTLGPNGEALERWMSNYVGVRHAVAVNSGTSALEIPLRYFDVAGRDVLVPTNTFVATPAAVLHAGGRVRFMDLDPATLAVSVEDIERALTPLTAGVIVVHIAGYLSPQLPEIAEYCRARQLFLLEDAAHALGATLDGQHAGNFGDAAACSFYPTKVSTSAEGGVILTNDTGLRDAANIYRDQGKASFDTNLHTHLGYNWRLSELHAIVGLAQLKRLDEFVAARRRVARLYDDGLAACEWLKPFPPPVGCRSNYYKYVAQLDEGIDRQSFKEILRSRYGVACGGEVYELPCHRQPVFHEQDTTPALPKAEEFCARHVCLPMSAVMTDDDAERVVQSIHQAVAEVSRGASP